MLYGNAWLGAGLGAGQQWVGQQQQWAAQQQADHHDQRQQQLQHLLGAFHQNPAPVLMTITGKQYLVVCQHEQQTADTADEAAQLAASLAHRYQADAFILAPISKVSPKRDVVTTPIALA